ncbi:hypothetical protein [Vibrio sp. 10N.261.51.C6]|uniref:hypothetical protein n=1 Tax=Vibrio sp. 10N.261.51.C6 TaxID=3229676 RepID=UPI00354D3A40
MVNFTVMCVQPIEIPLEAFKVISNKKINESYYGKVSTPWIMAFDKTHYRCNHFKSLLSEREVNSKFLVDDLQSEIYKVYGEIALFEYLDLNSVGFDLIFDERVSSLTIVYEFSFNIDEEIIEKLFNDTGYDHEYRHNFYNVVRKLLVKEDENSLIGSWASQIRDRCLHRINYIFGFQSTGTALPSIYDNTGNISLLVNGISEENKKNYRNKISNSNQMAERVENNQIYLLKNSEIEFIFHGRFHTIISSNFDNYYRYFPILYHAQFMWSSVHQFTTVMDLLNRKVLLGELSNGNSAQIIDEYINKFELVRIHNQDMKMYFESDSKLVFSEIETAWTIKESLDEVNCYVSSFKEFIERSYQRKMEKMNRRQNTILFVISCIQSLGLISIWVDYLSLSKLEGFVQTTGLTRDTDKVLLLIINTWLPLLILILIFVMVYNAIFKK